jgi:hypothetical protein
LDADTIIMLAARVARDRIALQAETAAARRQIARTRNGLHTVPIWQRAQ